MTGRRRLFAYQSVPQIVPQRRQATEPRDRERPQDKDRDDSMRIYVGNLPFRTTQEELRDLFAGYGVVNDCVIPVDRETGRSRGFGFVDMDDETGRGAIEALDGADLDGRALRVNEARPRTPGGGGGGGGGYRSERGGGGGGYRGGGGGDYRDREPRYDDRGGSRGGGPRGGGGDYRDRERRW